MQYQFASSPLGILLLAERETGSGLCLLYLGDEAESLLEEARRRFPQQRWQQSDSLNPHLDNICRALEQGQPLPELTLDPAGTEFQRLVWRALCQIPYGKSLSYSQLAEAIGRPRSVRAVANACASNEISLLIPCHRVVHKNGGLSGYRWGVERKKQLLALEAGHSPQP